MNFELSKAIEILEKTPQVIEDLLCGTSDEWLFNNEGPNTWSPYTIVVHLIQGEKTDWMQRAKIILSDSKNKTFVPFDRFSQLDSTKSIGELLNQFKKLRNLNLKDLAAFDLDEHKLSKKGIHPELGGVTLKELLSTWVVHDLGHISQISRVMAKQYQGQVGVWKEYLGILKK